MPDKVIPNTSSQPMEPFQLAIHVDTDIPAQCISVLTARTELSLVKGSYPFVLMQLTVGVWLGVFTHIRAPSRAPNHRLYINPACKAF